jgi:hypothetical protein
MSTEQGLTDQNQPQTDEEAEALFEAVFNSYSKGAEPSTRELNKAVKEVRKDEQQEPANEPAAEQEQAVAEQGAAETGQVTQEQQEQPQSNAANPQEPVVIKPEDYEAALRKAQDLEHRLKSEQGRQAALQRQLAEARAQQATKPTQPEKPKEPVKVDGWDDLREQDPALAKLIEQREQALLQRLEQEYNQKLEQAVAPLHERQFQEYAERERNTLKEWVPNLEEIIQSKFYADWFDEQMPEIQKLAQRGNAQDCMFVLQKYDHDMALRYGRQEPPKEQPKQEQKPVDEKAVKLQESRDKRVNAAGVSPKQTPAAAVKHELDPEAEFERAYQETLKQYRR